MDAFRSFEDPEVVDVHLGDGGMVSVGLLSESLAYCMLVGHGDGAIFLDARPRPDYERAHVAGAWCLEGLVCASAAASSSTTTAPSGAQPGPVGLRAAGAGAGDREVAAWEVALRSRCGLRAVVICGGGGDAGLKRGGDVESILRLLRLAGARPKEPLYVLRGGVPRFAASRFKFCLRSSGGEKARPLPHCPAELLAPGWGAWAGVARPHALYFGREPGAAEAEALVALRIRNVIVAGGAAAPGVAVVRGASAPVRPRPGGRGAEKLNDSQADAALLAAATDARAKLQRESAPCLLCGPAAALAAALFLVEVLPAPAAQSAEQVTAFLRKRCPLAAAGLEVPHVRDSLAAAVAAKRERPPPTLGPSPEATARAPVAPPAAADGAYSAGGGAEEPPYAAKVHARLLQRDPTGAQAAVATLHTVLGNILARPTEAKLRRLKGSNARVQREVLRHPEAQELLRLAGWVRDGEDLWLPETSPLQALRDVLAALPPLSAER